ncbi:unnamed protein product [Rhizophagus irregularis]|uniref:Uncharacterized protein n=1 Tax=Rhizophagus irregularis TaxID=588596 RepID=A0A2I1G269_9GLOM|nr:hypothetical protein RhiirA4_395042 [Rhizophagus irregularis]CAB4432443.1 unnamed protein product [Rhizophagus irregularis]CAB4432746.1 unnamed protein product [Rhizophagus irregularis]
MNSTKTFEETKQNIENQDPLTHILEKQAKEIEDFSKRMSLEFQTSYQEYIKKQNEQKLYPEIETCQCKEKDNIIQSLKSRIEELEKESYNKNQDIKNLQKNVQSLFNIIVKKGIANVEEIDITMPTKITITTEIGEEIYDNESTKQVNIELKDHKIEIEKDRLSIENVHYYDDIKDSYSDSAIDLFTDDDSSTTGDSIKTDNYEDSNFGNSKYDRPSEWLDVSSTLKQRYKIDKKNLDRWNSKMANNGLLPIKLVGKVDEEKEKKIQTHRKRHSTSAIWLKTYESKQKQKNQDEKFRISSFNFTKYAFNTTTDDSKSKQKDSKELSAPISLKSSVSTSISDIYTTSLTKNSLHPYDLVEHHKNNTINYSKSQQLLSQYK